jgi:hypothetical protein
MPVIATSAMPAHAATVTARRPESGRFESGNVTSTWQSWNQAPSAALVNQGPHAFTAEGRSKELIIDRIRIDPACKILPPNRLENIPPGQETLLAATCQTIPGSSV